MHASARPDPVAVGVGAQQRERQVHPREIRDAPAIEVRRESGLNADCSQSSIARR
jgi:hypothetical protein